MGRGAVSVAGAGSVVIGPPYFDPRRALNRNTESLGSLPGMPLADEKYVSFTTYKKDGGSTSVPVWIVGAGDGKLGFTTPSSSWKARRLANDDRMQIQPSDARGRVKAGTTAESGTAVVVKGTEFEAMSGRIRAKYGFPVVLIGAWAKLRKLLGTDTASDCAIVITLDSSNGA